MFVSFPKPHWDFFVWIAVSPLVAAIVTEPRLTRAFFCGYLAGACFLLGSCYWFVGVMELYGRLGPALAVGVLILFLVIFSCFFGAFALVEAWIAQHSTSLALVSSPFAWISMELARNYLITGFPWNLLGYAVQAVGLRRIASVAAVYGLSFLAVTTSALFAWVFVRPRERWAKAVLALWLALLVVVNRFLTPPPAPGSSVAVLVQPNVPLGNVAQERWYPPRDSGPLNQLVTMSVRSVERAERASATTPLVIWSENPAPFYFDRDRVFRSAVERMARDTRAYTVVGTVTFSGQDSGQPKNSAVVLDAAGNVVFQYDKIHLVPFGEYVPWWAFPGKVGKIVAEVGDFVPGSTYAAARTPDGSLSILICYEAIFPELVRRLVPDGPGVLVNVSDDGWYGDSSARFQHLEMARLRAIENGRYLLRATNDGITAVIDPYGQILEQLPRHQQMALRGHFSYLAGRTFYTAHGDVFAWLCVAVTVGVEAFGRKKRRKVSDT